MKQYGLIGEKLGHSFSKRFFTEKFSTEGIDAQYDLFELADIQQITDLFKEKKPSGLNVTIPYKEQVIPYLDAIDSEAKEIGAVNTIQFKSVDGKIVKKGYNTDVIGFRDSLLPLLKAHHRKALILGTGGASKAVAFVLGKLGIEYKYVSRKAKEGAFTYEDLTQAVIEEYTVIVNCSPVGMFTKVDAAPDIPYQYLTEKHLLYDLIYNPEETLFSKLGKERGATTKTGLDMLYGQAIASWKIWNE